MDSVQDFTDLLIVLGMKLPDSNVGCLGAILKLLGINVGESQNSEEQLPYRARDNLLSPAELSFFHVLRQVTSGQFYVCVKVRIGDLLFVVDRRNNLAHANRIERKHVDFVLCDPKTMEPKLVVELDDSSHQRKDRQDRDELVDAAFAAAGLPILHVRCARNYVAEQLGHQIQSAIQPNEIPPILTQPAKVVPPSLPSPDLPLQCDLPPQCPKCNVSMVERKAARGKYKGKRFWACPSYPECKKIVPID